MTYRDRRWTTQNDPASRLRRYLAVKAVIDKASRKAQEAREFLASRKKHEDVNEDFDWKPPGEC